MNIVIEVLNIILRSLKLVIKFVEYEMKKAESYGLTNRSCNVLIIPVTC